MLGATRGEAGGDRGCWHGSTGRRPWRAVAGGLLAAALLAGCGVGSGTAATTATTVATTTTAATTTAGTAVATTTAGASAARRGPGGGQVPAAFRATLKTTLDPLVRANTLTSAQETAVLTALSRRPGRGGTPPGRGSASTAASSAAATGAGPSPGRPGVPGGGPAAGGLSTFQRQALQPLVQQGTLTATQETAVLQAMQRAAAARRPIGTPTPGQPAGA